MSCDQPPKLFALTIPEAASRFDTVTGYARRRLLRNAENRSVIIRRSEVNRKRDSRLLKNVDQPGLGMLPLRNSTGVFSVLALGLIATPVASQNYPTPPVGNRLRHQATARVGHIKLRLVCLHELMNSSRLLGRNPSSPG